MIRRLEVFKGILWFLFGMATAILCVRMIRGLGVVTALSDVTPWGLWKGLNVFAGIAVGAGGFVVAAIAHVFHGEKYHPVARRAVLVALCAYSGAGLSLFFEIGMPWKIWGPIVFWNFHSPLFEVAWCVMLYLGVLAMEFAPTLFELTRFKKTYRFFLRLGLPAVILGIMISTLHQSTLGTIFLIMPERLHGLWFTTLLPELFFTSAIACGLAVIIFVSLLVDWLYHMPHRVDMLQGLARYAAMVLAFYLVLRLGDLLMQGKLGLVVAGTTASWMFLFEILLSSLIPLLLFGVSSLRRRTWALWLGSFLSALGFVFNRLAASGLAMIWATKADYFPTWMEFATSIGLISAFCLAFLWMHEHAPVESELYADIKHLRKLQLFQLPRYDQLAQGWVADGSFGLRRIYSLLFVIALALGFSLCSWEPLVEATPLQRARGRDVLMLGYPEGTVAFPHADHIKRLGKDSCGLCHHLHKPGDVGTPCTECHRDMYLETQIFNHGRHIEVLGVNSSCTSCHPRGEAQTASTAQKCSSCHKKDMMAKNEIIPKFESKEAPGMRQAAHKLCIACHREGAKDPKLKKPDLFRCATCHGTPISHGESLLKTALSQE